MNAIPPTDPVRVPVITPSRDFKKPSPKQQSFGALMSIIIIVLMIIIGAFYAYRDRTADMAVPPDATPTIPA